MNQLTKFLVDSILKEEDSLGTVALFGGGFKPPTKGHLEVVLQGLKEYPEVKQVYILVGSGDRNNVSQKESVEIWKMYQKLIPVFSEIIPVQSPFSYIKTYLQDHPDEKVYQFIGARPDNEEDEKDVAERSAFAKKYSKNAVPVKIKTKGGVSGTKARKAALSGNDEEFLSYFPSQLSNTEKQKIIDIIKSVIKEGDTYEKMAAKGKKAGSLKQGTVRKRLKIPKDKKIPLSLINKEIARLKKMDKDPDKKGAQLGDKNQKYYKALQLAKTLKTTTNLNENATYSQHIDLLPLLAKLTQNMIDKGYNIEPLPGLKLIDGDTENAKDFFGKTAYYDPNEKLIVLYTEGRHPKDIARSYAHEMIHHQQNLEGRLGNIITTDTTKDSNLEDIEKEAYLKGNISFRNWTDSLQEDGQKISDKNMDDYKKSNNPSGKVKDPFGLNAYARELAQGLEEALTIGDKEVERIEKPTNNPEDAIVIYKDGTSEPYLDTVKEGRKKKKDPKKGTGKKPKGSGRRLYTDEDPKDTVSIKFRTKEDIVDTLNKKSFKAKSHARQSQIINLIHQRVRAAYGKAKDPDTKARLKRGLDYITKRKEASKKKTQRLKKLKEQQLNKFGGDATPESTPKMSFEDRLAYYKDYYINVSPSTFDIITEDGTIVIGGLDKPYPKDFNDVKDTRQVPVPINENVPDAKDDGKAAPYGSGYEKLNEGRYDAFVNKLSNIVFEAFKDIHDRGDKEGEFEFRVDHPDDEHDIPSEDFYFDLAGTVKITDDEYTVDGGANAGFDKDGNEITPLLSVKFKIPKNPNWQRISFDIKDVIRHELEHLTQDGENVKPGKQMDDDQTIRDLIDLDLLPKADYFRLPKEIDAMLQGLYFKAKKSKKPYIDVINDYLDTQPINDEERENILKIWRSRAKALSLPMFEGKTTADLFTIYLDMDGVIVDFDKQFKDSFGMLPREFEEAFGIKKFWEKIEDKGVGFWRGMEWMPGGKELYNRVAQHDHALLSSPSRSETSKIGKRLWRKDNTPSTKLILARSANKKNYADKSNILIDDREDNIQQWKDAGGIGILYKSASQVMKELEKLGL